MRAVVLQPVDPWSSAAFCTGSSPAGSALPTAAMVCWLVGAIDEAAAYLERARPLHAGTKRIARVVMLSAAAAAGVALDRGEIEAAIDFGTTAAEEARELGVEREVPLVRAILARAHLAAGDRRGAAISVAVGVDVAASMTIPYPLAIGLETSALVSHALEAGSPAELADLLATSAAIRARGDRPSPPTLRPAVEQLRAALDAGVELDRGVAIALARRLLGAADAAAGPAAAG